MQVPTDGLTWIPHWVKQRQIQLVPSGDHSVALQGPLLPQCQLKVEPLQSGKWRIELRCEELAPLSAEIEAEDAQTAWLAALERYRHWVLL
ncbi:MAG: hypothetical protein C4297_09030 [Gemmataceae bacterium]